MIDDSWRAVEPFGDDHLRRARDDPPDRDHVVVGVGRGEAALRLGLEPVVELLAHPFLEFGQQRLDVQARGQPTEEARHSAELDEVGHQRRARARVLDLDGDLAAVRPDRAVHLSDAGGRGRHVVELAKALGPGLAELLVEYAVHDRDVHRRGRFLQAGQRCSIGRGRFLGQGRLEDRQGLAELHRPALELAQHLEQLFGRAALQLGGDLFARLAGIRRPRPTVARPAIPSGNRASRAVRAACPVGISAHDYSLLPAPRTRRRSRRSHNRGCGAQLRRRIRQSGSRSSRVPASVAGSSPSR